MESSTVQNLREKLLLSAKVLAPYNKALILANCADISARNDAVDYMKTFLMNRCPEAIETSVQIFNKFLALSSLEVDNKLRDTQFIGYAACASILLAVKSYIKNDVQSYHLVKPLTSPPMKLEKLISMEQNISHAFDFQFYPDCTPLNFVKSYLSVGRSAVKDLDKLLPLVDSLIKEFLEESDSILFAPSTIAVAALLLSFSMLQMDFEAFLDVLPDFCLPNTESGALASDSQYVKYMDVDSCIVAFREVPMVKMRNRKVQVNSPTSVAFLEENC